jgi:hypothetical protein
MLGAIFAKSNQHAELAELQTTLVERARARGDAPLELARMVQLGEILELRVNDARRALETYDQILSRDPHHRGALEAVARLAEERAIWDKAESALTNLLETATGIAAVETALRLANARKELGDNQGVEDARSTPIPRTPTFASAWASSTSARRNGPSSRSCSHRTRT